MTPLAHSIASALDRRAGLLAALAREGTDSVRLYHGATEGRPGLAVDRYGPLLLVQTWQAPLDEGELDGIADAVAAVIPDLAGIAAAGNGASVLNVDFAASALEIARRNADANDLSMDMLQADVIPAVRQLAGLPVKGRGARRKRFARLSPRRFDLVVLDPPTWATSAFGAVDIVRD